MSLAWKEILCNQLTLDPQNLLFRCITDLVCNRKDLHSYLDQRLVIFVRYVTLSVCFGQAEQPEDTQRITIK